MTLDPRAKAIDYRLCAVAIYYIGFSAAHLYTIYDESSTFTFPFERACVGKLYILNIVKKNRENLEKHIMS